MINALFENTFLMAQIFGLCAMTFSICAWQLKNPRNILRCYVPSSLFWAVQYFLLGAYSAVITSVVVAFKDFILSYLPKEKTKFFIPVFLVFIWSVGIPFVKEPLHIIPLIIITIFNITLLQPDNRGLISRSTVLCQIGWLVFNFSVGSWMGVACSIFVMSSAITGMARVEAWEIGKCYRTFLPSIRRSLFDFTPRTYP